MSEHVIRYVEYEPWLLGWRRWAVTSERHKDDGSVVTYTLASGRWRWRRRNALPVDASVNAEAYWRGPVIDG